MTRFPDTRVSLIQKLDRMFCAEAWDEFHRLYCPPILRVARFRNLNQNDADDIAQEVMLALVNRIADFEYARDRGLFRNWVRTVTENKIRDFYRKKRGNQPLKAADEAVDPAPTPEEAWDRA